MRYVLFLSVLLVATTVRGQVLNVPPIANEGDLVTITYDEIPDASFGTEQVTIDFGDGTSARTNAPGRTARVVFQHVYLEDSHSTNYIVTVTEEDFEMGSTETTKAIQVSNVRPTFFLPSEYVVPAGRLTTSIGVSDPSSDRVTASVSYGDGSSETFDLGTGPNRSIPLNHTYNATNIYFLSVSAGDDEGAGSSASTRVRVTGLAPAPSLSIYTFAGVVLTGELGRSYDIQKSEALASSNWTTVATLTLTNNPQLWMDLSSTNSPRRFYRAIAK